MKPHLRAMLICGLLAAEEVRAADDSFPPLPPLYGTVPSRAINNWIKLFVLGPRTAPFPVVIFSTKHFKSIGYQESVVVLPPSRYSIVARYTASRIAKCEASSEIPVPWYTLAIQNHHRRQTSLCVTPQHSGCDYLFELLRLPDLNWAPAELKPIKDLAMSIRCSDPAFRAVQPLPDDAK